MIHPTAIIGAAPFWYDRDPETVETTSLGAIDAMLCDVKTHENLTPFSAMLAAPGIREANQGERERFLRLYDATTTTE